MSSHAVDDPLQIAIERELHQQVLLAIEELPPAHREAALLFYYESLTVYEIARITGASPGAIKVRLHRARNQLRKKLGPVYIKVEQKAVDGQTRRKTMVKVNVVDIVKHNGSHIVLLREEHQKKVVPIWIGQYEAEAIALGLLEIPVTRPHTYDFMVHLLDTFGARLEEARVDVFKDDIFYGAAMFRVGNDVKEVDARPSDVIALAIRTNSPIFVAEEVLQQAGKERPDFEEELRQQEPEEGVNSILEEWEAKLKQGRAHRAEEEEK